MPKSFLISNNNIRKLIKLASRSPLKTQVLIENKTKQTNKNFEKAARRNLAEAKT